MPSPDAAWSLFTRLGEAQILLPAMVAAWLWLLRTPRTRPLAADWMLATGIAASLTTATKVAFMGWFVGSSALDYTGISGHAMFAAAVLPVLARMAASHAPAPWPRVAVVAGLVLAAAIAVSRVTTHAHSTFEAALGFLLGAAASLWALRHSAAPSTPTPTWLGLALLAWLVVLPLGAPPSATHDWVTRLSLHVSGRSAPYTRDDLRRRSGGAGRTGFVPARQMQAQPVGQRQLAGDGIG